MNRLIVALSVALLVSASARADESSLFKFYKDSARIHPPCELIGPATTFVDSNGLLNLVYTCTNGSVVIRTDATRNPNIRMWLDWPMGKVDRTVLLTGYGWAFECGHAIVQYRVTIGQITLENVAGWGGIRRQDVADAFPTSCQDQTMSSGLGFSVDISTIPPGTYPMSLLVMDDQGKWAESNSLFITVYQP